MKKKVFFKPRVGDKYKEDEKKVRILVLGVCHICSLECPHHHLCGDPEKVWDMDHECPCYKDKDDQEYYRLGNSNEIEIQSFIDCESHYPAYKIFTYYMLKKAGDLSSEQRKEMWDQLAFTNMLQFFHDSSEALPDDKDTYDKAFPALMEVVNELEPHVIFAWDDRLKECLRHKKELEYEGKCDMQFGLSLYVFHNVKAKITPKQLARLKNKFGVRYVTHQKGWYMDLVRNHLGSCIIDDMRKRELIKVLSNILYKLVMIEKILGTTENHLCFPENDTGPWTSLNKGLFLRALKEEFPELGSGVNSGIENMFNEKLSTNKRSESLLKNPNSPLINMIKHYFPNSVGSGKTFSK